MIALFQSYKRMISRAVLGLVLSAVCVAAMAQLPVPTDVVWEQDLDGSQLQVGTTVVYAPTALACGPVMHVNNAVLDISLNTGAIHELGDNGYDASIELDVTMNLFGGPVVSTYILDLNPLKPEMHVRVPLTQALDDLIDVSIEVISITKNAIRDQDLHLTTEVVYQRSFDPKDPVSAINIAAPIPEGFNSNRLIFSWEHDQCTDLIFPEYQMQIMRIYEENPVPLFGALNTTSIDWSQAATIETGAAVKEFGLTLAEGTGFYVWRVRAISDIHPGRSAHPNNAGPWYEGTLAESNWQGLTINQTGGPSHGMNVIVHATDQNSDCVFHYTQFDAHRNWSYSKVFVEGDPDNNQPTRVGEQMTYATQLLQARQSQARSNVNDRPTAAQTVLDHAGRPALSSIAVPVDGQQSLGYVPDLLEETPGNTYTAEDFDTDQNYKENATVVNSPHFDYFDNSNDPEIPSSESYPFSRVLLYPDGRPKQTSGPGQTHAFADNAVAPKTTSSFYAGVTADELNRIFGNEAYLPENVSQVVTRDPNGVVSTTYIDKSGTTLATALVKTDDILPENTAPQLGLPSEDDGSGNVIPGVSLTGIVGGDQQISTYVTEAIATFPADVPSQTMPYLRLPR